MPESHLRLAVSCHKQPSVAAEGDVLHGVALVRRVVELDGYETPPAHGIPDRRSAPVACGRCDQSAVTAGCEPLRVLVVPQRIATLMPVGRPPVGLPESGGVVIDT